MTQPDLRIYPRHLHDVKHPLAAGKSGFCNKQSRAFFARHSISWSEFIKYGVPAQQLLDTNDALARMVVEHAQQELQHGR